MFGRRLKELREGRGWSQSELARRAGLTANAISQLEDTEHPRWPYFPTLCKLAGAFELNLDQLAGPVCKELAGKRTGQPGIGA